MEYVKLELSFKEKFLAFCGLIEKRHLISVTVPFTIDEKFDSQLAKSERHHADLVESLKKIKEPEEVAPNLFFEDSNEVKSNL